MRHKHDDHAGDDKHKEDAHPKVGDKRAHASPKKKTTAKKAPAAKGRGKGKK